MRRVYLLQIRKTESRKFYGSLTALFLDNKELLKVSLSTLQHFNFNSHNFVCNEFIIQKDVILSSTDVRSNKRK